MDFFFFKISWLWLGWSTPSVFAAVFSSAAEDDFNKETLNSRGDNRNKSRPLKEKEKGISSS